MKQGRIIFGIVFIGLAALVTMLTFTSPTEIGPAGVLLFFTTLYVTYFGAITALFKAFRHFALSERTLRGKDYLYAAVMAFGPIMLLMARSFGVLSPLVVALVVLFIFLAEFLVAKRA